MIRDYDSMTRAVDTYLLFMRMGDTSLALTRFLVYDDRELVSRITDEEDRRSKL